ncbi:Sensor histidine kinase and response regulator of a two component complex [Leptospira biflexa serovar Patoc strain 'Patoc 1 (Ames)']|uniref:histidine kinase n=1 Tax=Leptospira biflexa serovar Patoc (strain Patoc 1 / ATCC 23582 / Paris) TaxID=456481 RepID=B0SM91_LEPBP|nr:histidine kinase N-terminal 7TM domain-containing protein [Leptospira biflexa]ABZ95045.1 Sensor histidine kinase and response regulator of a two component complex [Leptospira biflexa serovar Patoc strain 'Patoc 1 (Ames)']ABZ98721.1 Putative signal transduction histidine kinase; putative membrane protein [Leptospira biflexa serovar Patoc strain 'Patoc 1 (Paris)']
MWQYHPYSVLLFLAFSFNLGLGLFVLKSFRLNLVKYLLILVFGSMLWTGFYGIDFIYITTTFHRTFISLLYMGVAISNVGMVLVSIEFTNNRQLLTKRFWVILALQPLFTLAVCVLDPLFKTLTLDTYLTSIDGRVQWIQETNIGGFIASYLISFFWSVFVAILLFRGILKSKSTERNRYLLILISFLFIWVAAILHKVGIRPLPGMNITAVMCTMQAIMIFFAIGYYRMFDLVPLVRGEIVDELDEAVVILDFNNRVVDWNSSAENLFSIKDKSVALLPHDIFFQNTPELISKLDHLSDKRTISKWSWEKEQKFWEVTAKQIRDSNRKKIGMVLVFRDNTEQRNLEKQMANVNRELLVANGTKDRFLSIISHDLRGPLAGIKMLLKVLNEDMKKKEDALAGMTQSLVDATESVFSLLENLLEWSKLQRGQEEFRPNYYRLDSIVLECVELFSLSAKNKGISFEINIPNHAMVYCDDRMIITVIRNLISNALKFSHQCSKIEVSAIDTGYHWLVSIRDFGVGMSKTTIDKLFRAGEVIKSIGTQGETGNGIGLLLCSEFVTVNGGTLSADSDGASGSVFQFSIPKKQNEEVFI